MAMALYIPIHEAGHLLAALLSGFSISEISLIPYLECSNIVMGYVLASGENPFVWSAGFLITFIAGLVLVKFPRSRTFGMVWLSLAPATSANDLYHVAGEGAMRASILMSAIVLGVWFYQVFIVKKNHIVS
jgi:hypothetical protein